MKAKTHTRDLFPIGQPIKVSCIIDSRCGWEFDAPLHIMEPFHSYREVGSISYHSLEAALEDILIDLDVFGKFSDDGCEWPYLESTLKRLYRNAKKGKLRSGIALFEAEVLVSEWGEDECGRWDIVRLGEKEKV